jgi:hypothetical protein
LGFGFRFGDQRCGSACHRQVWVQLRVQRPVVVEAHATAGFGFCFGFKNWQCGSAPHRRVRVLLRVQRQAVAEAHATAWFRFGFGFRDRRCGSCSSTEITAQAVQHSRKQRKLFIVRENSASCSPERVPAAAAAASPLCCQIHQRQLKRESYRSFLGSQSARTTCCRRTCLFRSDPNREFLKEVRIKGEAHKE